MVSDTGESGGVGASHRAPRAARDWKRTMCAAEKKKTAASVFETLTRGPEGGVPARANAQAAGTSPGSAGGGEAPAVARAGPLSGPRASTTPPPHTP